MIIGAIRGPSAAQTMDLENNTHLVEERERDMRQLEVTDRHLATILLPCAVD